MGDDSLISLKPGTVIAERYEVIKCLGAGSMGLVYACKHRELTGHKVAVKVLFPEVANDTVAAARFKNEIFASYDVSHPNVVRAYEYLRDGDLVAYTMEFVGGGDLAHRLERGEAIPISEAIEILAQMCAGVQAIHDAGIVHRDLKPENILLSKEGVVKIADFGIARTGYGPKLTEHGGVVGTIDYVSPEYMLNSQVDWRSDIYAMGILAYEMVTGESPFKGESVYATMTKRLKSDAAPPSSLNPECPAALDTIILRAMARNIEERYQSAADMFADLQPLLPENPTLPSGAFLQVSRNTSGKYVGPKLNEGISRDSGTSNVPSSKAVVSPVMNSPVSSVTAQPGSGAFESAGYMSSGAVGGVDSTRVIDSASIPSSANDYSGYSGESSQYDYGDPEVVSVAAHYHNNGNSAAHDGFAETIVSYNDLVSRGGSDAFSSGAVPVVPSGSEGIDRGSQRLSQLAASIERSVWVEVATLAVAILIGVGLGFFLVRTFFPDLLGLDVASMMVNPYLSEINSKTMFWSVS